MYIINSIIVFGILILVHEFGHFIAAKRTGVRIEQFSLGFGPPLFKYKRRHTEYSICSIPLGGYVKLAGDNAEEFKGQPYEYLSKSVGQRARIIFCGPLLNYILAFLCFWLIVFLGASSLTTHIGGVIENFGAQEAGLEVGDKILAVDDKRVELWQEMRNIIHKKKNGDVVQLLILRSNQKLKIPVVVKEQEQEDIEGKIKTVGLIGIRPIDARYKLTKSFLLAGNNLFCLTRFTLKVLSWIALGKVSFRESVPGPVEMVYQIKQATGAGVIAIIYLFAILSMSLAIFNILPIPVLDGGHLLFLFIEKIRKRRLSNRTESIINQIGISLLIFLVIFVFYNDFSRRGVFNNIYKWWTG